MRQTGRKKTLKLTSHIEILNDINGVEKFSYYILANHLFKEPSRHVGMKQEIILVKQFMFCFLWDEDEVCVLAML